MNLLDFQNLPVWTNALVLTIGGFLVWRFGTKLSLYADAIAERTKMTRALAGALLLGVATSLPEISTTVTAATLENAPLAVNNLFGGVAMQLAVLAVVDGLFVHRALTFEAPKPVLLLGGVLLTLQCALGIAAIAAGDVLLWGNIGVWPLVLTAAYVLSLYFMNRFANRESWIPAELPETSDQETEPTGPSSLESYSTIQLSLWFALHCLPVVIGGLAVSVSADALAHQTGLGSGFLGATLVAVTTSLPEISTTTGAIRIGSYTMAISNIFGTNSLEVALLLPADIAYRRGAIINSVDDSALLMGAIAIVMTSFYLWGLLERRDRTVLRLGIDSAWVLLTYLCGLTLLYFIAD